MTGCELPIADLGLRIATKRFYRTTTILPKFSLCAIRLFVRDFVQGRE
jgi:hypothetical protein